MSIRFHRGAWHAHACWQGQRASRRCSSKEEALAAEQELLVQLGRAELPKPRPPRPGSWGELWRVCLQADWATASPSTVRNASLVPRELGPDNLVADCTMATLDDLVARKRAAGCGSGHIRVLLSATKVMLTRAVRLGWIDAVPLFPETRTLRLPEARDLVLEQAWVDALLRHLEAAERREEQRLVVLLLEQGLRIGEALSLSWDRVDLKQGRIQLVGTKGKRARRLPLTDAAWSVLRTQHEHTGPAGLVFTLAGTTVREHFTRAKLAACDELGLADRVRKEWTPHTFRHTCLTRLAQQGWSAPQLQAWAGHASLSITQRYVHSSALEFEHLLGRRSAVAC